MNTDFLSPITLTGPFINTSTFTVDTSVPQHDLVCTININMPRKMRLAHDDGMYVLAHEMEVEAALVEQDESKTVKMRTSLSMNGAVAVHDRLALDENDIEQSLRLNAISMFYAAARSHIELLSGQSAMGRFTIPPIDPKAYLDSLDETGE